MLMCVTFHTFQNQVFFITATGTKGLMKSVQSKTQTHYDIMKQTM